MSLVKQKAKCLNCGKKYDWNPSAGNMTCPKCGSLGYEQVGGEGIERGIKKNSKIINRDLLVLQQYLDSHSLLKQKKNYYLRSKIRYAMMNNYEIAYLSLLKKIVEKYGENDKWSEVMLDLMQSTLANNKLYMDVSIGNRIKFSGYNCSFTHNFKELRPAILIDSLFILAFDDIKRGKDIYNGICSILKIEPEKFLPLLNCFYYGFTNAYDEIIWSSLKGFNNKDIFDVLKIIDNNRRFLKKKEKKIMITANMSAGKSTLLNALAGKKVNKTQNEACTAKIHYLYNKAGEDGFSCEYDHELRLNASEYELMEDNESNESTEIIVTTRFRTIKDIDSRVCFVDTPGVNSSRNLEHKEATESVLGKESCDLVLYLLNGENIGTDDDVRHLAYVSKEYKGKVIFLINKLDRFKKDEDSIRSTLEKMKIQLEEIGYKNPQIYPISAYAAYLAKMSLYGEKLNEDEIDELEFRKRKLSRKEFMYHTYYNVDTPNIDEKKELEVVLRNSGILALEKLIY